MNTPKKKKKALLVTGKRLRRRMDQDLGKLEVETDTAEIEQVASHELLGLIIDEEITYEVHVDPNPNSATSSPSVSAFYAISTHT